MRSTGLPKLCTSCLVLFLCSVVVVFILSISVFCVGLSFASSFLLGGVGRILTKETHPKRLPLASELRLAGFRLGRRFRRSLRGLRRGGCERRRTLGCRPEKGTAVVDGTGRVAFGVGAGFPGKRTEQPIEELVLKLVPLFWWLSGKTNIKNHQLRGRSPNKKSFAKGFGRTVTPKTAILTRRWFPQ